MNDVPIDQTPDGSAIPSDQNLPPVVPADTAEDPPFSAARDVTKLAAEIGLCAQTIYLPTGFTIATSIEAWPGGGKLNRKKKAKQIDKGGDEAAETKATGLCQFNRYIEIKHFQFLADLVGRLKATDDWNIALLSDPANADLSAKMLAAERSAYECQIANRTMLDLLRETLGRGAQQQLELERIRPHAQQHEQHKQEIDELLDLRSRFSGISSMSGWRRLLIKASGLNSPPLFWKPRR